MKPQQSQSKPLKNSGCKIDTVQTECCESSFLLNLTIPNLKLKSPNCPEHWSARAARVKKEKKIITIYLLEAGKLNQLYHLPCTVVITRVAPRKFDDDNFISSCKGIRDFISSLIIPGLSAGRADSSEFITWKYEQIKKGKAEYAVNIKIY